MATEPATAPAPTAAPSAPPSGAPGAPSSAPSVASLTADRLPASSEPTPSTAEVSPPAADGARPTSSPPPAAPSAPTTFKYRGREYTAEDLVAQGLLGDLITTAEQLPALQRRYTEVLEEQRRAQQPPPAQPQPIQPAQIRAAYMPAVAKSVEAGYMERDLAELYPDFAANAMYHVAQLYDVATRLQAVEQGFGTHRGQVNARDVLGQLHGKLDGLAAQGGVYDYLKDQPSREAFIGFLSELDPRTKLLMDSPDLLGRLAVAFKHEAILEAAKQTADTEAAKRAAERARAQGDGRGARPAAPPATTPSHLESLISDALPARR